MEYIVTKKQMDDSFEAVMVSLKNQIDMHYDEVRTIAKQAEETLNNFDETVVEASENAANQASQMAVAEIKSEFDGIYGAANVFATAVLTE